MSDADSSPVASEGTIDAERLARRDALLLDLRAGPLVRLRRARLVPTAVSVPVPGSDGS